MNFIRTRDKYSIILSIRNLRTLEQVGESSLGHSLFLPHFFTIFDFNPFLTNLNMQISSEVVHGILGPLQLNCLFAKSILASHAVQENSV